MTRKQQRSLLIAGCLGVLALAGGLVLVALQDTIVFFYSPSDVLERKIEPGQRFRLGGLVEEGSIVRSNELRIGFSVTDGANSLNVAYDKILPDLFREAQGVVAEGMLRPDGVFVADNVLAKHDENYMPPEVAAALKKRGVWQGGKGDAAARVGGATQ